MATATESVIEATGDFCYAQRQPSALYFAAKRALDLAAAGVLLVMLLPLFAIVGAAILVDSGWPIFYLAPRVGRAGRRFTAVKFRSMRAGADIRPHIELVQRLHREGDECGLSVFKVENDKRVTRLGAILRRSSIDELPQLWNVLRGEMSLVGPRPDTDYSVAVYEPWMTTRLEATPGMTGLWQVSGRSRIGLRAMMRLDVAYVEQRSLALDLKILLLTIPAVLATGDSA